MKIKKAIGRLFWWENPKVGMLFVMSITAACLFILLPVLFFFTFVAPPNSMTHVCIMIISGSNSDEVLPFSPITLLLFYALIVVASYYVHLLRSIFSMRLRWAVPLALMAVPIPVLCFCGVMLPCAIKSRNRRAIWMLLLWFVLGIAAVVSFSRGARPLAVALYVLATYCWVQTIRILPSTPPVGAWSLAPVSILVVFILAMGISDSILDRQLEDLQRTFDRESRISLTKQQMIEGLTNGVPLAEHPYPELFSKEGGLDGLWDFKDVSGLKAPTEEEVARFNACGMSNAVLLAKIDRVTESSNLDVAWGRDSQEPLRCQFGLTNRMMTYVKWARWYALKARFAAWSGDSLTALEAIARLERIRQFLIDEPDDLCLYAGVRILKQKLICIQKAVPVFSDETLVAFQSELQTKPMDFQERGRRLLMIQYYFFEDEVEHLLEIQPSGISSALNNGLAPPHRLWMKLERHCFLAQIVEALQTLDDETLTAAQRFDRLEGENAIRKRSQEVRMPLCALGPPVVGIGGLASAVDGERTAVAGLAVERYRRRHGVLPKKLDDLVPEFLDAVPVSCHDGRPLDFQQGDIEVPVDDKKTISVKGFRISSRRPENGTRPRPHLVPAFVVVTD